MIYHDFMNEKFIVAMVRADKDINEIKLVNESDSNENYLRLATDEEIASLGIVKGFIGPVNLQAKLDIYVDEELQAMDGFYVGANEKDYLLKNVKFGRDFTGKVFDLRLAKEGLMCPFCGKPLKSARGIEVGQVFKLQTKYSKAMNCTYVNEKGENVPMVMGCYGIGVTSTFQSIVDQYHDEFGIKWPLNLAPYHAVVLPVKYSLPEQMELSDKIHEMLESNGVEVVLDDRNQGVGFKAKDWELIGVPFQIIVGKRALEGIVELKDRQTLAKEEVTYQEAVERIIAAVKNI
jgi:prolyl-tRNA synthetase